MACWSGTKHTEEEGFLATLQRVGCTAVVQTWVLAGVAAQHKGRGSHLCGAVAANITPPPRETKQKEAQNKASSQRTTTPRGHKRRARQPDTTKKNVDESESTRDPQHAKQAPHVHASPGPHLPVVEEAPHEVRLRASVIPHPVLAEPPEVVRVHVGRVQREGAVESRQRLLALAPVSEQRAQVGPRFLERSIGVDVGVIDNENRPLRGGPVGSDGGILRHGFFLIGRPTLEEASSGDISAGRGAGHQVNVE